MTGSGQNTPARRGFLASLSSALTPPPVPDDDDAPLRAPRSIITASVLTIIGGALFLFQGLAGLFNVSAIMKSSQESYAKQVSECQATIGGVGTAVTATSPTEVVSSCQRLTVMTPTDWQNYRTFYISLLVVFAVIGVAVLAAGWFLRAGAMWARRTLVGVTLITVLGALLLGIAGSLTLAAALALLVALVLCYLASGGQYFLLVKSRRKHA